jgi:hypothetical protein
VRERVERGRENDIEREKVWKMEGDSERDGVSVHSDSNVKYENKI